MVVINGNNDITTIFTVSDYIKLDNLDIQLVPCEFKWIFYKKATKKI